MQPHEIRISDEEIEDAEEILFGTTEVFDKERKEFIKNLETIDLHAVPGSGKTTALLAKLLILEQHLPFDDGSGILVISHTNAAIDEIQSKIGAHCPKLFAYPHHIGTIQSFVDKYLAIPMYLNEYREKPYRIDNEIYDEKVDKYFEALSPSAFKTWLDNQGEPLKILKGVRFDLEKNLTPGLYKTEADFRIRNKNSPSYKGMKKMKEDLMAWGYLHFDDAYYLAKKYLHKYPDVRDLLRKRFSFVFVDEMQDMDGLQYDLLESLFYCEDVTFQRIGDRNQAIFSGEILIDEIWRERETTLSLIGSHRLTPKIAETVKYFGLEYLEIEGRRTNEEGSEIDIKPHMIVYDDDTINQVLEEFSRVIINLQMTGKFPVSPQHPIKAVGWRIEADPGKYAIKDYHESYERHLHKSRVDYPNMFSYLVNYDKAAKSLTPIRKNILNALLRILRSQGIISENGKAYTERGLLNYLRENYPDRYEDLKRKLFKWTADIYKEKQQDAYADIRDYVPNLLKETFGLGELEEKTNEFLTSEEFVQTAVEDDEKMEFNKFRGENQIEIMIGTVHSIKGETHSATLYLETYYGGGQATYESARLEEQFKRQRFDDNRKRHKQSMKMVYVGFSRPTHLLCFAVHKDRLPDVDSEVWEIIEISTQ